MSKPLLGRPLKLALLGYGGVALVFGVVNVISGATATTTGDGQQLSDPAGFSVAEVLGGLIAGLIWPVKVVKLLAGGN